MEKCIEIKISKEIGEIRKNPLSNLELGLATKVNGIHFSLQQYDQYSERINMIENEKETLISGSY